MEKLNGAALKQIDEIVAAHAHEPGPVIVMLHEVQDQLGYIPFEAIELIDVDEWEEISEVMSRQGKFFALRVKGDSMSPRIQEGDILIVQQTSDAESGDVVIAKVNGADACCKRLIKHPDGIVLQSFNPAYEPMYFNKEEMEQKPVQIIGKGIENRQKFT